MKIIIGEAYSSYEQEIIQALKNFQNKGRKIGPGKRNILKAISLNDREVNVKSFKIPNAVNKIAYRFLRASKAERSYNYALELLKRGINTPAPIAYAEEVTAFVFLKSYYVSEHIDYELTFRDLDLKKKGHKEILQAFTRFTFQLHEKEIEFLDHSPGNTLIETSGKEYKFYLVDLNRMNFKKLNLTERLRNFERLSRERAVYEVMAEEYAKLIGRSSSEVFEQMWSYNQEFFSKRQKKEMLKKKLKGK